MIIVKLCNIENNSLKFDEVYEVYEVCGMEQPLPRTTPAMLQPH